MTKCDLSLIIDLTPPDLLGTIRRAERNAGITTALLHSRALAGVPATYHNRTQYVAWTEIAKARDKARSSLIGFD